MTIIIHYFIFIFDGDYWEIFASLNFCKNGNFNNFTKNIFMNDPRGQHKKCGIAIFHFVTEQIKWRKNFPVYGIFKCLMSLSNTESNRHQIIKSEKITLDKIIQPTIIQSLAPEKTEYSLNDVERWMLLCDES